MHHRGCFSTAYTFLCTAISLHNSIYEDEDDVDALRPVNDFFPTEPILEPAADPLAITVEAPLAPAPSEPECHAGPAVDTSDRRWSPCTPSPSCWHALLDSIEFTSCTELVVAESKQAVHTLKECKVAAHNDHCKATLKLCD